MKAVAMTGARRFTKSLAANEPRDDHAAEQRCARTEPVPQRRAVAAMSSRRKTTHLEILPSRKDIRSGSREKTKNSTPSTNT